MANPIQSVGDRSSEAPRQAGARASLRPRLAAVLPAALAVAGWWKLRELLYHVHWGRGPTIFLLLLASIALVLAVPRIARMLERADGEQAAHAGGRTRSSADAAGLDAGAAAGPGRSGRWVAAALLVVALWASIDDLAELRTNLAKKDAWMLDVGRATWAAALLFMDRAQNPYTARLQPHEVTGERGVGVTDGRVEIFGVPYYYGFAYFPATFLSYAPFRLLDPGPRSIRIGNAFFLAALFVAVGWLAHRLAPDGRRPQAAALATVLLMTTTGLGNQLFHFAVTDFVIPVYTLFALIALTYRRHLIAGALVGLAFAAKLLPALLFAAILFFWLARRGGIRSALLGFAVVSSIVLLPFVVWHPAAFLSATFLFYVTHHAAGDTTSLWYYLPQGLRFPFQALGGLATLAVSSTLLWSKSDDQRDLVRVMVVASLLFLAFGPMIHLNYQFAVAPLAGVALAADAMGARLPPPASRAARPATAAAR